VIFDVDVGAELNETPDDVGRRLQQHGVVQRCTTVLQTTRRQHATSWTGKGSRTHYPMSTPHSLDVAPVDLTTFDPIILSPRIHSC